MRKHFFFEKFLLKKKAISKAQCIELITEKIRMAPLFEEVAFKLKYLSQDKMFQIIKLKNHFQYLTTEEVALKNKYIDQDQYQKIKEKMLESLSSSKSFILKKNWIKPEDLDHVEKEGQGQLKLMEKKAQLLKKSETFELLHPNDLFDLADIAEEYLYKKDHYIINENQKAEEFYLLSSGQVKVTKTGQGEETPDIFITTIDSPEIFGEASIFQEEKRTANIVANSDEVLAFRFERNLFVNFLNTHYHAALIILSDMVKRLLQRISHTNRELALERRKEKDDPSVDNILKDLLD